MNKNNSKSINHNAYVIKSTMMSEEGISPQPLPSEQSFSSHSLADNIYSLVDHEKLEGSIEMQSEIFQRVAESTRALQTFNDFSAKHYQTLGADLEKKTKQLKELQKDLEIIHKKIRFVKGVMEKSYPQQYSVISKEIEAEIDLEEDE